MVQYVFVDTHPEAERVLTGLLQAAPQWRRIEIMCGMIETLQNLVISGVRERHPHAGDAEVRRRMADILLGPELAEKAYGPLDAPSEGVA